MLGFLFSAQGRFQSTSIMRLYTSTVFNNGEEIRERGRDMYDIVGNIFSFFLFQIKLSQFLNVIV